MIFFKHPNSQDYLKAVRVIPVKGFDASGKITNSEMKKVIGEDPLMQVQLLQKFFSKRRIFLVQLLQKFFPKRTAIEYIAEKRVKNYIGEDGKLRIRLVLGRTLTNPKTGKIEKIVIFKHGLEDAVEDNFIKEKEIEKASSEKKDEAIKKSILVTCAHERRGHMFTSEVLSEETKFKVVNLFYGIKERGATFTSGYAQIDSEEYFADGWGIYEVNSERLKKNDPKLYNLIQEIEKECRSFIETSKKLIFVRVRGKEKW